jgi:hypothetical protein
MTALALSPVRGQPQFRPNPKAGELIDRFVFAGQTGQIEADLR